MTGLFRDRESAERAYQNVVDRGYGSNDVNLVMSDETRQRHFGGAADRGRDGQQGRRRRRHRCRHRWRRRRRGGRHRRGRHLDRDPRPRPGHRRPDRRGAGRRGRRRCRRHAGRCADRLGHPGRARQGIRERHPRRRHPDGREAAQHDDAAYFEQDWRTAKAENIYR
ncbi:MAG: hypothetical protein MZW92_69645 [Comamonadaceae bacterium]|nr:hypothetical protein [Comamonadaceae bacterium]